MNVLICLFLSARCRITIKKRLSDCAVLGCRLVLILDDLLWVLTDDQLKAALHFGDSLSGLLSRATEATQKTKGARKLEVNQYSNCPFTGPSGNQIVIFWTQIVSGNRMVPTI
jgi:hypothetical protein